MSAVSDTAATLNCASTNSPLKKGINSNKVFMVTTCDVEPAS